MALDIAFRKLPASLYSALYKRSYRMDVPQRSLSGPEGNRTKIRFPNSKPTLSADSMARTVQAIQRQIDKLQREADALRSKEVVAVVERIRSAIEHYQLGADDLFGGRTAKRSPTSTQRSAKAPPTGRGGKGRPVAVKFKDSEGHSWTGRGSQPRWLTSHLKAGRQVDDFRVSPQ